MAFLDFLFHKKEGSVIGIDIGSSSLKVVQLRKQGGKAILETYGELALGPYSGGEIGQATNLPPEKVAEMLKDLLRESKVTTTNAGVSISFARSLLSLVELPYRKDPEEQKTIIQLEARKYIPVPLSEVQLDWFVVPDREPAGNRGEQEKSSVLIVAVHNDELLRLQTIVTGSALAASFYEIEIFSIIRSAVDEPVKPVLVFDIGAASTRMYVVEHGVASLSHSVSVGSQDITRAIAVSSGVSLSRAEAIKREEGLSGGSVQSNLEIVFSRIFSEARRVLIQYETSHTKPVVSIVITGGGGVTKSLAAYAKKTFPIEVRIADPFAKIEAPAFMRPVLEEIGPEFSVAIGLALRKLEEV
ncbi:MAG: type IV pilus assembly protein PilM [Minisyncoccia bacterium]